MSAADTGSLYFEAVPLPLRDVMWRVGASVRPADFVAAVVDAWRAVEVVTDEEVHARFRETRACRDFRDLLRQAARPGARVLAIGCGDGFPGRSSAYAASVVREVYSPTELSALDRLDITPGLLFDHRPPYDIVVTHSLVHFVHQFRPLCRLLCDLTAPAGFYVMANEPNARFWSNPECLRAMRQVAAVESREKRLRKLASPSLYWRKLRRIGAPQRDWSERINQILRDRLGLTDSLTPREIVRVIDPYVPDPSPGDCAIGADGMNWTEFESGPLSSMRLERVVTSGYVMRANPDRVPDRWRALDASLAAKLPLDGCSFSALWRNGD